MTRGAQVGGVLLALVGLFDLRGWPRSSWGKAALKLALPRAAWGCHLRPLPFPVSSRWDVIGLYTMFLPQQKILGSEAARRRAACGSPPCRV